MRRTWTLAKREFRGYFDHPTAYILVVAFLVLALFLTFRSLYASGVATMRPLFNLLPWLFVVFVPAIAMRSLAEERRSGTLEWLLAQPVTELEVVAGKFLGDWLFALVALAGTLPAALGILLVSEADPGIVAAQYAGGALLAALLVAAGLFASAATRNQITAFIVAVAVGFALILVGLDVVLLGLPPALARVAGNLALLAHFDGIARGVLDLRDVLYFLSMAAFFLTLAYALVARERLSPLRGAFRRLRLGVAALAVGVLLLNLLGARLYGRLDLTADRLYTLSPGTEEVLRGLDDVVTVKLVVSSELPPEFALTLRDVRDLLADFRRASDSRLRVQELNPDRDEDAAAEASSLGVRPIQFNVLRGDEFEVRRGWLGLAILYADQRKVIPVIDRTDDLEYRLAASIAGITAASTPRVAFLTGFGARSPWQLGLLRDALADRYAIETVSLETDSLPPELSPDSFRVAVLVAPERALDSVAVETIRRYLDAGGSALLLLEGGVVDGRMPFARPVETGLESLLEERGIRLAGGFAYDLRSHGSVSLGQQGLFNVIAPYPLWPVAVPAGDHPLTRGLEALTLAWATPLELDGSAGAAPLWTTTEFGGRREADGPVTPDPDFAPPADELAARVLAAVAGAGAAPADAEGGGSAPPGDPDAGPAAGRLIVVGDADFLQPQFARGNPQNLAFAVNAVDWLAQDEALIAIRSKDRTPPPLIFESEAERAFLKWANLAGVPLLLVLAGALRVLRRRRLAGRSWRPEAAPA